MLSISFLQFMIDFNILPVFIGLAIAFVFNQVMEKLGHHVLLPIINSLLHKKRASLNVHFIGTELKFAPVIAQFIIFLISLFLMYLFSILAFGSIVKKVQMERDIENEKAEYLKEIVFLLKEQKKNVNNKKD